MSDEARQREPITSEFHDDPDMVELVEMFIDEMPDRIQALADAFENNRRDDLTTLAHQLKGASGGYGYPTLGETAGELEKLLRAQGSPDLDAESIREAFERLVVDCSRIAVR